MIPSSAPTDGESTRISESDIAGTVAAGLGMGCETILPTTGRVILNLPPVMDVAAVFLPLPAVSPGGRSIVKVELLLLDLVLASDFKMSLGPVFELSLSETFPFNGVLYFRIEWAWRVGFTALVATDTDSFSVNRSATSDGGGLSRVEGNEISGESWVREAGLRAADCLIG